MARNETAGLMGGTIRTGGEVWNAFAPVPYSPEPVAAIEIASRKVSRRFGLSLPLAREVCRLAQIGGAA